MGKKRWLHLLIATCLGAAPAFAEEDEEAPPAAEIVISVAEQKLALVKDGGLIRKYPISTSKFGLGDSFNSYKTPLGRLRVCDKFGASLPLGAVLKSRNATGEILPVNAPGRDPIVTRILWLEGLEACNAGAKERGIYIHGTVEESKLGQPVSYGCIRMRSRDVVELFEDTSVGTGVRIITERLPHFRKVAPKSEVLIASNRTFKTTVGAHGLITVKTVRGADAPAAPPAPKLASAKPAAPSKTTEPRKAVAEAEAPAQAGEPGPTIVFSTPKVVPPPAPRLVFALNASILTAKLSDIPQPPARAVAPETPALRTLALQIAEPIDFLAAATDRKAPLDHLTAHLLEPPPVPQFRIAARASLPAPRLPEL